MVLERLPSGHTARVAWAAFGRRSPWPWSLSEAPPKPYPSLLTPLRLDHSGGLRHCVTPHLVGPRRLLKEWSLGGAPQLAPGLAILCMLLLVLAVLLVLGCALCS